jgi:hypothetical protein
MYLLSSALEAQGGLVTYDDLLVRSKKTKQNNVARMGQMEKRTTGRTIARELTT